MPSKITKPSLNLKAVLYAFLLPCQLNTVIRLNHVAYELNVYSHFFYFGRLKDDLNFITASSSSYYSSV